MNIMKFDQLQIIVIILLVILLIFALYVQKTKKSNIKKKEKPEKKKPQHYPEFAQDTIASLDKTPDNIIMNPEPDPDLGPLNAPAQLLPRPKYWHTLNQAQKLNWIIEVYYKPPVDKKTTKEEEKYLKSLPKSRKCDDVFTDCAKWASNGDCTINPEFMLYNCPKSCASCKLSPDEKYKASEILNKRENSTCVYYGKPYPDPNRWIWERVYGAQ